MVPKLVPKVSPISGATVIGISLIVKYTYAYVIIVTSWRKSFCEGGKR